MHGTKLCSASATTLIAVLCACLPRASIADEASARPTPAEIQHMERHVPMPDGAGSKAEYVRYYFISDTWKPRTIVGRYVERHYLDPAKIPAEEIVVVESEADVDAPFDTGCGVITVTYSPRESTKVHAWCSGEVGLPSISNPAGSIWLLLLALPVALLLVAFRRFLRWRDSRSAPPNG